MVDRGEVVGRDEGELGTLRSVVDGLWAHGGRSALVAVSEEGVEIWTYGELAGWVVLGVACVGLGWSVATIWRFLLLIPRSGSKRLPSYQRISDYAISSEPLEFTRLGKLRRHVLDERYERARRGKEGSAEAAVAPVTPEEMSGEDRALLENTAAMGVWKLLTDRYPDRRLAPETSMQLDLDIDSLGWVNRSRSPSANRSIPAAFIRLPDPRSRSSRPCASVWRSWVRAKDPRWVPVDQEVRRQRGCEVDHTAR